MNGYSEEQKSLDPYIQSLHTENAMPQYLDEINEYDDQIDESGVVDGESSSNLDNKMANKINS
jgi:hypothetical protein